MRGMVGIAMALIAGMFPTAAHCGTDAAPALPLAPEPPTSSQTETAWLGVFLGDAPDGGVEVVAVVAGGPAAKAGLKDGDELLAVNERPIADRQSLKEAIGGLRPGERVVLSFLRDGSLLSREIRAESPVIPLPIRPFESTGGAPGPIAEGDGPHMFDLVEESGTALGARFQAIPADLRLFYGAPADAGLLVSAIEPGGPAAMAGLKVGDILVRAAGEPLRESSDLEATLLVRRYIGGSTTLDIVRGGKARALFLERGKPATASREREARLEQLQAELARLTARIDELRREMELLRKTP